VYERIFSKDLNHFGGAVVQRSGLPDREFPARVGPVPYLGLALLSQTGMSFVQQGLIVLGAVFVNVYNLNLTQLGLVTTALSLGVMISMVFIGGMVDSRGPRTILFWGTVLMTGLSLLLLMTKSFAYLLVVLVLVGMALAIVPAAGTKAVFTAFQNRSRGLVMGIRQTGVPIGATLAAWLLPALAVRQGLHTIYEVFSLELLLTGWAFCTVMYAWCRKPRHTGWMPIERSELKHLLRPALTGFVMSAGQYIMLTYSITALQHHHIDIEVAGIILAASQITGGAARILLGLLSDRVRHRSKVISGVAVSGAMSALIVALLPMNTSLWVVSIVWVAFGFSAVGWNALVLTWAGESVSSSNSGAAMSLTGSFIFFGAAIFPPLFGAVVDLTHHYVFGWLMLVMILGFGAWVAFGAEPSLRR
jgi:MFS family permease